jgi:2-hydroxy-3-keto-5-methylthiopentenyl-1-phosphate phosphatase
VAENLAGMCFSPGARSAIEELAAGGWAVVVVSAGCEWYIRRHFLANGIPVSDKCEPRQAGDVVILACPGAFVPGQGLQIRMPTRHPYVSHSTGVDKLAFTRALLERYEDVAFAGDGRPDRAPALEVRAERRFATGWLADDLEEERIPFHRFTVWSEIAGTLLGCQRRAVQP